MSKISCVPSPPDSAATVQSENQYFPVPSFPYCCKSDRDVVERCVCVCVREQDISECSNTPPLLLGGGWWYQTKDIMAVRYRLRVRRSKKRV